MNGAIIVGESGNVFKRLVKGHISITPRIFSQSNVPHDSETSINWSSDNSRSSVLSEYSDFRDINSSVLNNTVGDDEESEESPSNLGTSDLDIPESYRPKRCDDSNEVEPFSSAPQSKSNQIKRLIDYVYLTK